MADVVAWLARESGPAGEPVTLAQAKAQCRVTSSAEDSWFTMAIAAARGLAEARMGRPIVSQNWSLYADRFPYGNGALPLLMGGVSAVSTVTYTDEAGNAQTLAGSVYEADLIARPAQLVLKADQSWPATQPRKANAVRVQFAAGWANAAAVPAEVAQWVLLHVAHLYESREAYGSADELKPNPYLDVLLAPYSALRVG